jgi:hypothetical protein
MATVKQQQRVPVESTLTSIETTSAMITREAIERRAYALYLARDREDGHDVDDWLQAEQQLQEENRS